MNHFNEILERTKTTCVVDYLLTGTTDKTKQKQDKTYSEKIEAAYEYFLASLENLFPDVNQQNEDLIFLIADFSTKLTDVYMEAGFLYGIQLLKNLEQDCWKFGNTNHFQPHF